MVSDEKSAVIQMVVPLYVRCHFSFTVFQIYLSLVFVSLNMLYLSIDFFWFILFGVDSTS